MASPALTEIINTLRANPYSPSKSVETLRAESAARPQPLPPGTRVEPVVVGGVPAEWITTGDTRESHDFLFIHGGGFYRGSAAGSRSAAAHIASAARARVLSIDYRLAPEHPFPAAVDDAVAAYRWLLAGGSDPGRLMVGGISAGGGLTLSVLLAARDAGDPLPAGAVPLSPWTDLSQTGESFVTQAEADPMISKSYLDRMAAYYLDGADPATPLASPIHGDLGGLPPLLLQVGSAETMLCDTTVFAERARQAGVDVTAEVWPDMIHGWHGYAHALPEARQAIERIGEFYASHTG